MIYKDLLINLKKWKKLFLITSSKKMKETKSLNILNITAKQTMGRKDANINLFINLRDSDEDSDLPPKN